ncbi:hypothetical protein PIB30_010880 [Stylosanthes scabra]|uniref:Saccharopine dehydrogenase NADP binding domain-containing protein n=1 Tax=Stylosanthes scabra TaxID=79078 RepID=A0ABU6S568_9FABA|nr:hypothetical protein [Stylosanthes scabra]
MQPINNKPLYDLIIFGASGFTGKYVVRETLKFLNVPSSPLKSIALAGRTPSKLSQSLQWAIRPNKGPLPDIPILTANTSDPSSLVEICSQTSLLLNCVGPYRLHGEPIVAACAAAGCDYLDISGEPEFMERMEEKYHDRAVESGTLMVSACGFDSVPAELGLMFNSRQWVEPAVVNSVEAYVSLESEKRIVANFAMYESTVLGVANAKQLRKLRRSRPRKTRLAIPGSRPSKEGSTIEHQKKLGLWAVKLPSADATIVKRTLSIITEKPSGLPGVNESADAIAKREAFWSSVKPAHFGMNLGSKSPLGILRIILVGIFIGLLGNTGFGRWLLLTFPSIFSLGYFRKKGPSEEEVERASFKMWFVGKGFSNESNTSQGNTIPDMEVITRISGPEIGYITTPIILVQCALVVLSQRNNLPKGGVYTPGIVFGPTDLQEKLEKNGISFDVISKGNTFSN